MTTLRCMLKETALRMGPTSSPTFSSRKRKRPYPNPTSTNTRDRMMSESDQLSYESGHASDADSSIEATRIAQQNNRDASTSRSYLDKNDYVCSICDKEGDLLLCDGPCLSSYHIGCLGLQDLPDDEKWFCENCKSNQHPCYFCKQVGRSVFTENTNAEDLVMKCRAISCGKFYHMHCAKSLPLTRLVADSFICPLHTCASCKVSGKSTKSVRCIRCPTAFHSKCAPRRGVKRIMDRRIICASHITENRKSEKPEEDCNNVQSGSVAIHGNINSDALGLRGDTNGEAGASKLAIDVQLTRLQSSGGTSELSTPGGTGCGDNSSKEGSDSQRDTLEKQRKLKRERKKKKKQRKKKREKALRERERLAHAGLASRSIHRDSISSRDSMIDDDFEYTGAAPNSASIVPAPVISAENNPIEAVLGTDDEEEEEVSKDIKGRPLHTSASATSNVERKLHKGSETTTNSVSEAVDVKSRVDDSDQSLSPSSPKGELSNQNGHSRSPTSTNSIANRTEVASVKDEESSTEMSPHTDSSPNETSEGLLTLNVEVHHSGSDNENSARSPMFDRKRKLSPRLDVNDDNVPMQRVGRAAAAAANSKLLARTHKKEQKDRATTPRCSPSSASPPSESAEKSGVPFGSPTEEDEEEVQWVQCDSCKKWRTVPSHIDLETLPEQWFCRMNTWDFKYSHCEVPEEQVKTSPTKMIGSHLRRQKHRATLPTGGEVATSIEKSQKEKHRKRKQKDRKFIQCEHPHCGKWRAVPSSIDIKSFAGAWYCHMNTWCPELASCNAENSQQDVDAILKKGHLNANKSYNKLHRSAKRIKTGEKPEAFAATVDHHFKAGRKGTDMKRAESAGAGRDTPASPAAMPGIRRNSGTLGAPLSEGGKGKRGSKQVVCQWVQCEKCEKWRRLPMHVDVSTLPDKWFCSMNKWNPMLANCDAEEEADQDPSASSNSAKPSSLSWVAYGSRKDKTKLCYRELLFGSNGLLRKAYSDDPSVANGDSRACNRDDQYRESSMYRSPKKKIAPPSYFKASSWASNVTDGQTRKITYRRTLEELILHRLSGTQLTRMELAVALHCDYDYSRRNCMEKLAYFPFSSIADTLQQLVSSGAVECISRGSSISSKGKQLKTKGGNVRSHSQMRGNCVPMLVEPEYEPVYRKMPKKPLKTAKPWKRGDFDPCASLKAHQQNKN